MCTATEPELVDEITRAYTLGECTQARVISTGFEDTNLDLQGHTTRVVAKVFTPERAGWAERTAHLIERARDAGVRHPRLHTTGDGRVLHELPGGRRCLVMDHLGRRDFYHLGRTPTAAELGELTEQLGRLHRLTYEPGPVSDPWQITQLIPLARRLHAILDSEQRRLVDAAVTAAASVARDRLPCGLVHGDPTKGNVLLDQDGRVVLIDFGVAHLAPRVQDLAVAAANLTHGCPTPVPQRAEALAEHYNRHAADLLTGIEREALRRYAHAAAAMELLGALDEWHRNNRDPEVAYLIDLGIAGLRDYR